MFDFGWQEFMVIAFVLVLVVGPKDLPRVLRAFTKFTSQARKMSSDFTSSLQEMSKDDELKEVKKAFQDAKSGDFDEISDILDGSLPKDVKTIGEKLETDLKQVYNDSQDTTTSKER